MRSSKLAFILGLLGLMGLVPFAGCSGSGHAESRSDRESAFEEVFGVKPSADVRDIESSWVFVRDSYVCWIRFTGDETSLARMEKLAGIKPVTTVLSGDAPGYSGKGSNSNAPDWWRNARLSRTISEYEINKDRPTESEQIQLWIDREHGVIYAMRDIWH